MKTLRIFPLVALFLAAANFSFAQKIRTETFKVSGECGMCKKKIEKAAKEAGATAASWNQQNKTLKVTYSVAGTSPSAIQQKIADAGYDTPGYKATDEAYNKLHACCQYEREVSKEMSCCADGCEMSAGSGGQDGKCIDEAVCKDKGCCKDSEACKKQGCCSSEKTSALNSHSH